MSYLGFSTAQLGVVKRGEGCREQGVLCQQLGARVAPVVRQLLPDGYEMEYLHQPAARGLLELLWIVGHLREHVWSRPAPGMPAQHGGWLEPLLAWAEHGQSPRLLRHIAAEYPEEPTTGYRLIHGDPTLANLLVRRTGAEPLRVITDPMPRAQHRREIPSRVEVDHGKLVQSAMGWERILGVAEAPLQQADVVLAQLDHADQGRALLWGAIHLERLRRRSELRSDTLARTVHEWAEDTQGILLSALERR